MKTLWRRRYCLVRLHTAWRNDDYFRRDYEERFSRCLKDIFVKFLWSKRYSVSRGCNHRPFDLWDAISNHTIVLTELQRVAAIALSNTPGGDGIDPVVADFDAGALKDVGTNPTGPVNGIPVSESADAIVPIVYNGTVNLSTGLVQIFASETIDTTPASWWLQKMFSFQIVLGSTKYPCLGRILWRAIV